MERVDVMAVDVVHKDLEEAAEDRKDLAVGEDSVAAGMAQVGAFAREGVAIIQAAGIMVQAASAVVVMVSVEAQVMVQVAAVALVVAVAHAIVSEVAAAAAVVFEMVAVAHTHVLDHLDPVSKHLISMQKYSIVSH